ncbi:hypothetical protein GCM10027341_32460 [Spirosoma knui]
MPVVTSTDIGGAFENRDYMYQGMPEQIAPVDISPGWNQKGQKLFITGTIFQLDGKTPVPDVVLYYYHTNVDGKYLHKPGEARTMSPNRLGQTHGYIRGWVKTDKKGKYSIYTVRPGVYPTRDEPAHIHLSIKEPSIQAPYYIDEFVFDDDELLNFAKRRKLENRGGSGILRVLVRNDLQIAEHNIILGLNIPNYPQTITTKQSGLKIGEDQPSFTPFHAFGPDKGTRACPVCKYGRYHGILYFVGNNPDWPKIKKWLTFLEQQSVLRRNYLKAYFIYGNAIAYEKGVRQIELEKLGTQLNLKNVALTFASSFNETESEVNLNKIDPSVENTFVIFKNRAIIDKYIDLEPTAENFALIKKILDTTKGAYFDLPEPKHN